ncbi:bifunctional UDP-N-acetylglucosamine diphosphorylase/glucosamine-1-phosphate N-acetyltransferase GlmU [Hyphomicrobium methylovorum]|uniref:bifunctional UDP-N-acetylglucosamine diphosphorylase/glucosamine-1-phosphate N-acetyltransferase GlmU n=1 Tax=Hyphomicrobium methylovorum TaxID=84 RepID=UPI0015E79E47|nr:bifunctional UDP-N-acetylglucosamine diphosphorylase/glucosamine-1-phosphate N-acetyltransferase GlmU [Hyphomicrobium methylovorum]MBA2127814.1 bifunctional UDP-N-acetylglucosamine diphosphorylase/glucosamine-1-phosphate N-acetyltransferase GlmU [Hyphomicrobium methylovorum]
MTASSPLFVVLAAGKGARMKSALPKVLHKIAGRSLLAHVLATASSAEGKLAVVVGPEMEAVGTEAKAVVPAAQIFVQVAQCGTADAVKAATPAIDAHSGDVIVLYADTPLIRPETIQRLRSALDAGANVAVLGFRPTDPTGYGRLVTDAQGRLTAIREQNDATEAERKIGLCNSGVMAFRVPRFSELLGRIGNANAKGEYYLTDAVELAIADKLTAAVVECDATEVMGVNSRDQLAEAEAIWQSRARIELMRSGVTMIAPETVWLNFDTRIGQDVAIEPNVVFGPGVTVEAGAKILGFCHIEGATIGAGSRIGPFARFRPGARLGPEVHIGNFVEVKNTTLEAGAKANHLSYLGDGHIGAKANVGAGTIFCNYDGFFKHKTEIGEGAFVGSNTSLVAPIKVGAGAYIGSGSVITKDVGPGALALERGTQEERPGWAAKFRQMMARRKAASTNR